MAVPTYLLIAADLRSKIEAGKMRPGAQLPPEKNLQDEYGKLSGAVSRNTVRSAIEMLVREGLLEKRRGQGTFIVGKLGSLLGFTSPAWPDPASSMEMHLNFDVDDLDAHLCLRRTRQEARERLVEEQAKVQRGIPVAARSWKLGEYLDYWLANVVKPTKRPATYALYEINVRVHLEPGFGEHHLKRLSVPIVQAFLNSKLREGQSIRNVRILRQNLSAALTRAVGEELVVRNAARLVGPALARRRLHRRRAACPSAGAAYPGRTALWPGQDPSRRARPATHQARQGGTAYPPRAAGRRPGEARRCLGGYRPGLRHAHGQPS